MENKTGKPAWPAGRYFKYAIGEIILVVIGILIALQINNWNEGRVNKIKLEDYLNEMIVDLNLDIKNLNNEIDRASMMISRNQSFLEHRNYDAFSIDSLEKRLETFSAIVRINQAAFNKIQASGITDFRGYNDLIEEIDEYYTYKILSVTGYASIINGAVIEEDKVWRYQQKDYEFRYGTELTSYQNDVEAKIKLIELLKSPTARNILKIDIRRRKYQILLMQKLKIESQNLVKSVASSLTNNN
jgi:hypothetical protein